MNEEMEIIKEIISKIPIITYPDDETKIHEKCMYYHNMKSCKLEDGQIIIKYDQMRYLSYCDNWDRGACCSQTIKDCECNLDYMRGKDEYRDEEQRAVVMENIARYGYKLRSKIHSGDYIECNCDVSGAYKININQDIDENITEIIDNICDYFKDYHYKWLYNGCPFDTSELKENLLACIEM